MLKVGFVGWRSLVGSVLLQRMCEENDLKDVELTLFSTSQKGTCVRPKGMKSLVLADAYCLKSLSENEIIITTQGSSYTKKIHQRLKASGWKGYWIDAASFLRMHSQSTIVLDPVNRLQIDDALKNNKKDFIGGNCTVSLMLMAISGLFKKDLVEWVHSSSYQAISGAGAKAINELFKQNSACELSSEYESLSSLEKMHIVQNTLTKNKLIASDIGGVLSYNLLPWIDKEHEEGVTKEEWKAYVECNKILNLSPQIPIDGLCVRVPVLRSHSQALTMKLKKNLDIKEIEDILIKQHSFIKIIPNDKESTLHSLTPMAASETLNILVGRLRKSRLEQRCIELFTSGDQLLWGAAEPLRRVFKIICDFNRNKK